MLLKKAYAPKHEENRMKQEGDVVAARKLYDSDPPTNLKYLIEQRFSWMNGYIDAENAVGVEIGCGTGVSKDFIRARSYQITDYAKHEWIDVKMVDALNTPFEDESQDFVVSSNMVHHVPYPIRLFDEMHRILKPGGVLLIQEINCSLMMRIVLRLMRHEGYNYDVNVFDPELICTDPQDLWSANVAIPNLLFDDKKKFAKHVTNFELERSTFSEFLLFLNSGGVIAKTRYVPLNRPLLRLVQGIDILLSVIAPQVFSLQRQVVLRKNLILSHAAK